ncbi:MAG: serine hydrolase [Planctomycetota bacterium]
MRSSPTLALLLPLLPCAGLAAAPQEAPTAALGPPSAVAAPADPAALAGRIGAFLQGWHDLRQFDGAVLVADAGEVVYRGALGLADRDWDVPNALDTRFRIGGLTKSFTAMLVCLLAQDGALDLDAPIGRYLPRLPADGAGRVTLHQLLHHTAGVPRLRARAGWEHELRRHIPLAEFAAEYCSGALEHEPGAQFRHNVASYLLAGAVVEAVTGRPFADVLHERILAPLQLQDTGCDDPGAVIARRATGYDEVLGARRVAPWIDTRSLVASDGMYSTVDDLWTWARALDAQRLLRDEPARRMFTPGYNDYGYGWHIDERGIWHGSFTITPVDGVVPGFRAILGRQPERGRCIVLLSNHGYASVVEAALGIVELLDGRTPAPPALPPAWDLARTILDDGAEEGLTALQRLPAALRPAYRLPPGEVEGDLDLLGHRLLRMRRADEAIRLFAFNTRAFGESPLPWQSLAAAQVEAGRDQDAIASLRQLLARRPWDEDAKAELAALQGR